MLEGKLQHIMEADSIRLIVCDVDGTVAMDGQVVSPELRGIFAALAERGVAATLATGRMRHHSKAVADVLGLDGYLICSEGGCVVSADGASYIYHADMDAVAVARVVDAIGDAEPALEFGVLSRDSIYVASEASRDRVRSWGSNLVQVEHWTKAPEPLLLLIFGPEAVVHPLAARLRQALPDDMSVILETQNPSRPQIKVCSAQVDKAVAARALSEHMGVGLANVLMFGDWLNDLALLRAAGYSIVPSSGVPEAQAAASKVSQYSCAQGFVARELEELFGL